MDQVGPSGWAKGVTVARLRDMNALLSRLESLGIDGNRILRSIFVHSMADSIVTMVALPLLIGASTSDEDMEPPPELDAAWTRLLLGSEGTAAESFWKARNRGMTWAQDEVRKLFVNSPRIASWLSALSLDELLAWRCPSTVEFGALSESPAPRPDPRDVWLHDRLTQTYLDDWAFDSLVFEWRYQHGLCEAHCPAEVMSARQISEDDLGRVIAARVTTDVDEKRPHPRAMTPSTFIATAVEHLEAGRRSAAAAIFDACRIALPNDPEAHNNYAFCILPDDPSTALTELELAAELGLRREPINVANRMLALYRLGRLASALELAEHCATDERFGRRAVVAFLWEWGAEANQPKLLSVSNAYLYVARFALHIARESSDDAGTRLWSRRLEALGETTPP
jgi:hypothetical protein